MTQEQKDLLLKDLCSRIPYGVKIDNMGDPSTLISINNTYRIIIEVVDGDKNPSFNLPRFDILEIEESKPYLFPISSMTEEQKIEEYKLMNSNFYASTVELPDFYNKNHIDYRGLIPIGLANDATGLDIY